MSWRRAIAVYAGTLALGVALTSAPAVSLLGSHTQVAFAAVWLYVPILMARSEDDDPDSLGLTLAQEPGAAGWFLFCLAILVPFAAAFAWWAQAVEGRPFAPKLPAGLLEMAAAQVLLVALPEETFFRGYLQPRLAGAPGPRVGLGRVSVSMGTAAASALFALAHLVLRRDPRTLAVFFPGLLFGLLREKSGSLLFPVLYHAVCNLWLTFLAGRG